MSNVSSSGNVMEVAVFDGFPVYFLAVHREFACAAPTEARTIGLEVEDDCVLARAQLGPDQIVRLRLSRL